MTIDCEKSYKLICASNCRNCSESFFLTNCTDCSFCWGCNGLNNKKYYIDNVQYNKEIRYKKIDVLKKSFKEYEERRFQRKQFDTILFSELSTGNHLRYCKMSENCIDGGNLENCKNCTWFFDSKECREIYSRGQNAELCYENTAIGENVYKIIFATNINSNANYIYYSMHCRSSSYLFGCIGLHDTEYCIFNKQYTKEEYEKQVAKIIEHMQSTGEGGEFFHPSLSPFGYNETIAQEYYPLAPLSEGEGVRWESLSGFGYYRSNYDAPKPVSDKVIQGKDLPDSIDPVEDSILQYAIACEITGKLFRIQPQELAFYRKHHIPLPRKHPDQRHLERLALRR